MSTKFMITGNDLIDGEPENCQFCAVALAVARDLITDLPNQEKLVPNIDGDGNYYIQEKIETSDGFTEYQDKYWIDIESNDSHELIDFISWFDCVDRNDDNGEIFQEHVVRYEKKPWTINCKLVEVKDARHN